MTLESPSVDHKKSLYKIAWMVILRLLQILPFACGKTLLRISGFGENLILLNQ